MADKKLDAMDLEALVLFNQGPPDEFNIDADDWSRERVKRARDAAASLAESLIQRTDTTSPTRKLAGYLPPAPDNN